MKDKNIAIILAAGKGSRMNSTLPKPFHEVAGRSIINHILDNLNSAGFKETIIVINKEHSSFFRDLKSKGMSINIAFQEHQLGTGDAVKSGLADYDLSGVDNVLVVFGDTPMLSNETFEKLISSNIQNNLTVLGLSLIHI